MIDWIDDLSAFADTDLAVEDLAAEPWFSTVVAGLQFYAFGKRNEFVPGGRVIPAVGDRLTLMRRPDNCADGNAVEVWWRNEHHLGHLPRDVAAEIAAPLDDGRAARAYVLNQGNGEAWSMTIIVVGDAAASPSDQRLERIVRAVSQEVWREIPPPTERQRAARRAFVERHRQAHVAKYAALEFTFGQV